MDLFLKNFQLHCELHTWFPTFVFYMPQKFLGNNLKAVFNIHCYQESGENNGLSIL